MFPLNDFNIVACALATFSAAVGYNVSRRRGRAPAGRAEEKQSRLQFLKGLKSHRRNSTASARSSSPSTSTSHSQTESTISAEPESDCGTHGRVDVDESLSDQVEDGSLKRKRSRTTEAALSDTPPSKRRRTPSPELPGSGKSEYDEFAVKVEETTTAIPGQAIGDIPASEPVVVAVSQTAVVGLPQRNEPGSVSQASPGSAPDSSLSVAAPISAEIPEEAPPASFVAAAPTTPPTAPRNLPLAESTARFAHPSSPRSPLPIWNSISAIPAARPSSAFQAFSGQGSAFASPSPFANYQKSPIWSTSTSAPSNAGSIFGVTAAFASSSSDANPLAGPAHSTSTEKVATVTGEEDEDVSGELKGAKVFIKRGEHDFCEGILGNVKLLKHKGTGAERILFRREPIWKVTMNVRLRTAVRCSFDEAQGALRVMLKERVEDAQQEQLVMYVLKRGKASRTDFADFARAVVESARAQEQVSP